MADSYRSYVVRVRTRNGEPDGPTGAVRIDVEDLLGGLRGALTGTAAGGLALVLADAVATDPGGDRQGRERSPRDGPAEAQGG